MLALNLGAPIDWTDQANRPFLDRLQGNILKGHGRSNVVYLFCRFDDGRQQDARTFLKAQAQRVNSAYDQLDKANTKRMTQTKDPRPFVCIFLTKAGYDYFGITTQPDDAAFQAGMPASQTKLNDAISTQWDARLRDPHVMILVAVGSPDEAQAEATDLLNQISTFADVDGGRSGELIGNQFFNEEGLGIENFGYVDGRSQPLVLTQDFENGAEFGGIDTWPVTEFPVDQFVVPDLAAQDPAAYGSYFVFRQLEQNVAGFKAREDEANEAVPSFDNRDSSVVGRLENGTPYEITNTVVGKLTEVTNNFAYTSDPPRCPAFAHIRKVNPRTDGSRGALMIRRGITYGTRTDVLPGGDPAKPTLPDEPADGTIFPSKGVGLLFQSYQANIADQFETSQIWANDPTGGTDPVIGQTTTCPLNYPTAYGTATTDPTDFFVRAKTSPGTKPAGPYVKLLGGAYFFAPSLPFLNGF